MGFGQLRYCFSVAAVTPGQSHLVRELRGTDVKSAITFTAGFVCQGTSEIGFALM